MIDFIVIAYGVNYPAHWLLQVSDYSTLVAVAFTSLKHPYYVHFDIRLCTLWIVSFLSICSLS